MNKKTKEHMEQEFYDLLNDDLTTVCYKCHQEEIIISEPTLMVSTAFRYYFKGYCPKCRTPISKYSNNFYVDDPNINTLRQLKKAWITAEQENANANTPI